jgi:hypothetical protein
LILVALGLAASASPPAFAGSPKTKAACERANMDWDESAKTCRKPSSSGY